MKVLTPRDRKDINEFELVTGGSFLYIDRYLSEEWDWYELWDYNFNNVDTSSIPCKCKFEGLKASGRRKGYPRSISALTALGFHFTLIKGGHSWYEDAYYQCSCGQMWKEEFVEAMQYNGNHAYPINDNEI
ncbi:hypothetical protein ACFOEK_08530 [Litoribrevibacter euphylliae]|uniref:Uncharacterized protein n=1 Tax=Litoribrevibacter euphylliae TaxID=1834034 RepID=A0ABV7HEI0_9GAMM